MANHTHDDHSGSAHHADAHDAHSTHTNTDKPGLMGGSAVWFFIILAGLFIATVNFVKVMGHDTAAPHGTAAHATETKAEHTTEPMQPVNQTANDTAIHSDDAHMINAAQADSLQPKKDAAVPSTAH